MFVARIDDGVVTTVSVGDDADWCATVFGGVWVATGQHVGIGWTYDEDGFRSPPPHPSWTWDGERWIAPVPYPNGDGQWRWDEDGQAWVEVDV